MNNTTLQLAATAIIRNSCDDRADDTIRWVRDTGGTGACLALLEELLLRAGSLLATAADFLDPNSIDNLLIDGAVDDPAVQARIEVAPAIVRRQMLSRARSTQWTVQSAMRVPLRFAGTLGGLDDIIWYAGQICYGLMYNLADSEVELTAVLDGEDWKLLSGRPG